MVALPCGSRSINMTLRRVLASDAARLMLVVVLPTPPFWLVIASTLPIACPLHSAPRDDNKMARRVQSRHLQSLYAGDLIILRDGRQLFLRINAFHCEKFRPGIGQMPGACQHISNTGKGARD